MILNKIYLANIMDIVTKNKCSTCRCFKSIDSFKDNKSIIRKTCNNCRNRFKKNYNDLRNKNTIHKNKGIILTDFKK